MEPDQILDSDFNQLIQEQHFQMEGIEWEGKPMYKFSIALLESGGYFDVMAGPSGLIGFLLGGIAVAGFVFYNKGSWVGVALSIVVGTGIIIFPDIVKNIRRKNTRYAFTKNRLFFKLWWWGKESVHYIDLADIGKISYQEYEDKSGTIHFMSNKAFDFYTYDFLTGRRRDYPSFEMVPNVIELRDKLEKFRLERIANLAAGNTD